MDSIEQAMPFLSRILPPLTYVLWLIAAISAASALVLIIRRSTRKKVALAASAAGITIILSLITFTAPGMLSQMIIEPMGGVSTDSGSSPSLYDGKSLDQYMESRSPNEGGAANSAQPDFLDAGGSANVNDRPYGAVFGQHYGTNPFIDAEDDNLSTFAMDVDTASYSIARKFLTDNQLPYPELVRTEEFINYFNYDYPQPQENEIFAIHLEASKSPFGLETHHLLKVGIQAKTVPDQDRKPATIILTIDTSSSMWGDNRIGLVKQSARILLDQLNPQDRIAVITYGNEAETKLPPHPPRTGTKSPKQSRTWTPQAQPTPPTE